MELALQENVRNRLPSADLAGEIDRLRDDLSIERDRNLRTLADFKNYRRRVERDAGKSADEGKRGLIVPLLEIIDDLEKALRWAGGAEQPVVTGVRIIQKKLLALLDAHGVQSFESEGTLALTHK